MDFMTGFLNVPTAYDVTDAHTSFAFFSFFLAFIDLCHINKRLESLLLSLMSSHL